MYINVLFPGKSDEVFCEKIRKDWESNSKEILPTTLKVITIDLHWCRLYLGQIQHWEIEASKRAQLCVSVDEYISLKKLFYYLQNFVAGIIVTSFVK